MWTDAGERAFRPGRGMEIAIPVPCEPLRMLLAKRIIPGSMVRHPVEDDVHVERMSRVLTLEDGEATLRPLEIIPHREGLPDFDVCIAPEEAVGLGNFALFVSATGIFAASINEPASKHLWRIARSRPYENFDELRGALQNYARTAFE